MKKLKIRNLILLLISLTFMVTAIIAVTSVSAAASTAVETPYGTAPEAAASADFIAFIEDSSSATGFTYLGHWGSFIGGTMNNARPRHNTANAGKHVVVCVMKNHTTTSNTSNNLLDIDGTLTFDLMGHTLTSSFPRLLGFEASGAALLAADYTTNVEFKNGSIAISNYISEFFGGNSTVTGTKPVNITFDKITFSPRPNVAINEITLFNSRGTFAQNQYIDLGITLKDCTLNYSSQTKITLFSDNASAGSVDCDLTIEGGTFNVNSTSNLIPMAGAGTDSYRFKTDGSTNTTFVSADSAPPTVSYNTDKGSMKLASVGYDNPNSYTLSNVYTDYGVAPLAEANQPFLMFYNGKFAGAYDTYYKFLDRAKNLMLVGSGALRGKSLQVLMTRDYTYTDSTYGNLAQLDGYVELDLGGHVLTHKNGTLFDVVGKSLNGNLASTSMTVKNGTILTTNNPLIKVTSAGTAGNFGYLGTKDYSLTYENVTFDKSSDASAYVMLGYVDVFDAVDNGTESKNISLNAVFNNCNFNSTNSLLFDFSKSDYVDANITINGGNLKSDFMSDYGIMKLSDSDDILTFGKLNGSDYMTLTLAKDSSTPTTLFNNGSLEFIRVSENSDTAEFKLTESGLNSYSPKVSITLHSSIKMNVYIPVDNTLSFVFDGVSYTDLAALSSETVTIDGKRYYQKQITLDAKNAAKDVPLTVTVSHGDSTATGRFTFSVPKYANKIFATGTEVEKQIIRDVLSYVRAAYSYFGTDTDGIVSKIDSLIGARYDETAPYTEEGSKIAPTTGLSSVTFALNSTPALKFYIDGSAPADAYEFFVDGKKIEGNVGTDGNRTYILLDVYAYAMCETVTYKINGTEAGSYHMAAYHDWTKTQNNSKLVTLVERFWKYCQSARDFKNSVKVQINYVDDNGNSLAAAKTVHAVKGAELSVPSPTVEGYYTRELYYKETASESKQVNVVYKRIPTNVNAEIASSKLPNIASWGDSITAGSNAHNTTVANQHLLDLAALGSTANGGTYSEVLRNLIAAKVYSGIEVANCGVGGETTFTIAARANTENYYLYLSSSISISGSPAVIPLTQSKNGMSGREGVFRKDTEINPVMSNVSIVGTNEGGHQVTVTGIITCTVTEDIPEGQYIWNCDSKYLRYTFTRTDGKTDTVNFAAGAKVVTNASVMYDGRTCIVFMGENGGYNNDIPTLIKQQEEILKACGNPEYYLIISTTSGSTESRKAITKALTERWGDRYINMGNELNSSRRAYEFVGYSEAAIVSVQENIINGTVTTLLLADGCHPNAAGYTFIGNVIFERLYDIGAFDAIFDYYDSLNA